MHDLDAYLPIFAGYATLLKIYLEQLKSHDNSTVLDTPTKMNITYEQAVYFVQTIETYAQQLATLKQEYREELSESHRLSPNPIPQRDPEKDKSILEDALLTLKSQTLRMDGYIGLLEMHWEQQDDAATIFDLTNLTAKDVLGKIRESAVSLTSLEGPLSKVIGRFPEE